MSNRKPSRPERVAGFLERTDPLVVQAMRKCFNHGQSKPDLSLEERAALDGYFEPRIAALVEELAARLPVQPAPIGPNRKYGGRRRS